MNSPFEVVALGVGDTFSEVHHTAALLLEHDGFRLAIDCPDRYRGALRCARERTKRDLTLERIDDVFITHVHGDHVNGLEGVAFYKRFAEGKRVTLHTTPDVRAVLWDQRLRAPMETLWDGSRFHSLGFDDYFDFHPTPWEQEVEIGPFRVTLRRTKHHVPTAAMLVRADRVPRGGRPRRPRDELRPRAHRLRRPLHAAARGHGQDAPDSLSGLVRPHRLGDPLPHRGRRARGLAPARSGIGVMSCLSLPSSHSRRASSSLSASHHGCAPRG